MRSFKNFHYAGLQVEELRKDGDHWLVCGNDQDKAGLCAIRARQVYLAAGTIASTRLALNALHITKPLRLLSCPTAAFILWLPSFLGAHRTNAFGYSQLAFVQSLRDDVSALGSTFSTVGLPMTEFARHLPMRRRYAIDFLRALMSSCVVGNLFLPGHLSNNTIRITEKGRLFISGGYNSEVSDLNKIVAYKLRRAFAKIGAYMLPMSFTAGSPGGDIHYAGSLPMKTQPQRGETSPEGELIGLDGVFVVDGACLPTLSEKSHTLTIMANADRIARAAALRFSFGNTNKKQIKKS